MKNVHQPSITLICIKSSYIGTIILIFKTYHHNTCKLFGRNDASRIFSNSPPPPPTQMMHRMKLSTRAVDIHFLRISAVRRRGLINYEKFTHASFFRYFIRYVLIYTIERLPFYHDARDVPSKSATST